MPHDLPSNLSVRLGNVDDRTRIRRAPESRSVAIGTSQFVWLIRHSIIFRLDQPKHQLDKLRSQLKRQRLAKVSARAWPWRARAAPCAALTPCRRHPVLHRLGSSHSRTQARSIQVCFQRNLL